MRSLTDFLGLGFEASTGTGGSTTGGHMPGFSAARLAAVSLIAKREREREGEMRRG